jgi:hypothetical protein
MRILVFMHKSQMTSTVKYLSSSMAGPLILSVRKQSMRCWHNDFLDSLVFKSVQSGKCTNAQTADAFDQDVRTGAWLYLPHQTGTRGKFLEKIWGCKLLYLQKIWKGTLHNSQLLMSYFPGWDWPCHNMLTICSTFLMELLKGVEKENTKFWSQWQYTKKKSKLSRFYKML